MRKLILRSTLLAVALLALPGVAAAAPEMGIDSRPPALTASTAAPVAFPSTPAYIWTIAASVLPSMPLPPPPGSNVALPARGTFHYPWFPPTTLGRFHPILGVYSDSDAAIVDGHVRAMDWGKIEVSINSWWGQRRQSEQTRIPLLMDRTTALGSGLKHSLYYEKEGFGNPSNAEIASDLDYIKARYAGRPEFARVDGRPVLFVYNADDTGCAVADKWTRLAGADFYLVLKVFAGFASCVRQPDDWHQYGPARAVHTVGDSFVISPGFWHYAEANPRLKREVLSVTQPGTAPTADWDGNVRAMVASTKNWHLITSQTEWGEGTAIAEAAQWATGNQGYYLDVLRNDGQGTSPAPPQPPTSGGAVVLAAGDIQNPVATCAATTRLLRDIPHDAVIATGDLQYQAGSAANFASFFRPCWGAAAPYAKLFPAPGNHESTKGGYCGEMSGRTAVDVCPISPDSARQRYEWRVGDWTFYSLDSGTSDSTGDLTAADKAWLDQRLATSATRCQGVYWHHPRFAAGDHGPSTALADDWADVLMPRRVDLVLNGHNHNYQRFARMGPNGPDPNGIRQIIVGTGGTALRTVGTAPAGREAASSASFGLLRLDLRAAGYDWRFRPATGTFTDSGSETCR